MPMDEDTEGRFRHPIGVASRRTGLSASVLRAWERRYGAVEPTRSKGGQRLYSDSDLQRLSLLKRLVDEGRSISQVANLPQEDLQELAELQAAPTEVSATPGTVPATSELSDPDPDTFLTRALEATQEMNQELLHRTLTRAAVVLRPDILIGRVVVPFLTRIGELWETGRMGAAQEHLASGVVRRFLEWLIGTAEVEPDAPVLLTATPQGHRHEFGALIAGARATELGWKAICLGPDLPADEIASAARTTGARAVAVSAIHDGGERALVHELTRLRTLLPDEVRLLAGGRFVHQIRHRLDGVGIEVTDDLSILPKISRGA